MDMRTNEGHLKWVHDLAPYIQKAAKGEEESLESFLKKVLKGNKADVPAIGGSMNEWSINLAQKLNTVAMSILTGDTGNARVLLEQINELVDNLDEATDKQRHVVGYCRDVLKYYGDGGGAEANILNQKWEDFINVGGNEVKATISFLKGMLGLQLQLEEEVVKNFLLEVFNYSFYLVVRSI